MKSLTINNKTPLPYSTREGLNRLRINFNFCGDQYKKVLITSSTPDEGKSFVSYNLWRMLAESGRKVVLVDADLRRSVMHVRWQFTLDSKERNPQGLAHYLAGNASLDDVTYKTDLDTGFIIPTFRTIANPTLLLQSDRFQQLLDRLGQEYDVVLVDTPPLGSVADGLQIAAHCDGAILVVRGGVTPRRIISSSLMQLKSINCPVLGTVLNRVKMENSPYYYKYARYGYYSNYTSNN